MPTTALLDLPSLPNPLPRPGPTIRTAGGRLLPLLAPEIADVDIRVIAHSLSQINRFTGHTRLTYSVAQHCCLVHDRLPIEARAYGLLHDAHESAVGDLSTPLSRALDALCPGLRHALHDLKDRHDKAIFGAVGLPWPVPGDVARLVKAADRRALATEQRDLMHGASADTADTRPWPQVVRPWPAPKAMEEFLRRFDGLARLGLLHWPDRPD